MEEIGALFGDDAHVASHWYDLSEEEKQKIAEDALKMTDDGHLPEQTDIGAETHEDSGKSSERGDDKQEETKVENAV